MNALLKILLLVFLLSGSSTWATPSRLQVMSFNVENLFDTHDDAAKNDETYLPRARKQNETQQKLCRSIKVRKWREDCLFLDWSEKILSQKLVRIAELIKSVGSGRGPDIVMLQEVENIGILQRLVDEHLPGRGYEAILLEGDDERGIDVALLSRVPRAGEAVLHRIPFAKGVSERSGRTRGILEVPLKDPRAGALRVFVLHLPSAFHPASMRRTALEFLEHKVSRLQRNELILVGGDFNVSAREERKTGLLKGFSSRWRISHLEGCRDCLGTVYHREWSFFDQIWISKASEKLGWRLVPASVKVPRSLGFQKSEKQLGPRRFEVFSSGQSEGLSDHWPVLLEVERNIDGRQRQKRASR